MEPIKIQDEMFKKLKKQKAKSIIILKNEENSSIAIKDKIEFINSKDKKIKRKVKNITIIDNIDILSKKDKKRLGYKKKEEVKLEYPKKDVDKYGLIKVDFCRKMKLATKIFLGIIAVLLITIAIMLASNKIKELKSQKIAKEINEIASEKIDYMFVDINPSFAFTVKNNKIENMACRNKDCVDIKNDLEVVGKKVTDAIEYLFNFAKDKGYNTKDGVTIKTTGKIDIDIKKLDYVKIHIIPEKEKDEILKEIIDNEEFKNVDNKSYYEKLWDTLKKDSDYGKVYECEMKDNNLSCYMKKEAFKHSDEESWANAVRIYANYMSILTRMFNKFGVSYEEKVVIPNIASDISVVIENKGQKLKFECDIDGECYALLVKKNGIYQNRKKDTEGGDFYYFNLYKDIASLDLLNPNAVINGLRAEPDEGWGYIDYETNKLYNFIFPDKYPIFVKDKTYQIEYTRKSICNLNTDKCTDYEYGQYKIPVKEGGYTYYSGEKEKLYSKIDKKTYDLYVSFHNMEGLSYGGSELEKFNSTDYLMYVDVNPKQYYICKSYDLSNENCKKITKDQWNMLARAYTQDGKYYFDDEKRSGRNVTRTICEIDFEQLKKKKCTSQYYIVTPVCEGNNCYESWEFLYEK